MGNWILTLAAIVLVAAHTPVVEAQPRLGVEREDSIGWIGISFRAAGTDAAARVHVDAVYRGSPADRAGIRPGDEIVRWNGRSDVDQAIRERRPRVGETVQVVVRRNGERDRELSLEAAARHPELVRIERRDGGDVVVIRPEDSRRVLEIFGDSLAIRADSLHQRLQLLLRDSLGPRLRDLESRMPRIRIETDRIDGGTRLGGDAMIFNLGLRSVAGAEFAELNEGLGFHFGTQEGVLVLRVAPETPAARSGLQAGDVIRTVGGEAVTSIPQLRTAVARAQRDGSRRVSLQILRRGQNSEVELRWE